jgi:dTDP-glucose pyrophosphorylase
MIQNYTNQIGVFEDLIRLYTEMLNGYENTERALERAKKKDAYERMATLDAESCCYSNFAEQLRGIIKTHFGREILNGILKWEEEYEKQKELSKSMWESYGSELAGDYNQGEVKALRQLRIFEKLMKSSGYIYNEK